MAIDAIAREEGARQNPIFLKVLRKYPDCPNPPDPPAVSKHWAESDFELFVASMGAIVPPGLPGKGPGAGPPSLPAEPVGGAAKEEVDFAARRRASGESTGGAPHIKHAGRADASLVIPSTLFMEDKSPEGLKLEAILTKFDRCRAACLQSISGMSTFTLVKEHGVGILLADLSFSVETETLPDLVDDVFVESEIDLPKMPTLPSLQRLVDRAGRSSCTATFGQMFVDMKSGMLSGNAQAYNSVKRPCDRAFGREIPTLRTLAVRKELAAKWAGARPALGRAFRPSRYARGWCVIAPSDCDTYNTLYHPKAPTVCERAALSTGETWACRPCTAFYVKFLSTMLPGTYLLAHILAQEASDGSTRALFAFERRDEPNSCVLCAFAVYGGPVPGVVYHEEFSAVTPKTGQSLARWARQDADSPDRGALEKASGCDLSALP
jgi:hypothetical protein